MVKIIGGKELEAIDSANAENNSIFLDASDDVIKIKDNNGNVKTAGDNRYDVSATYSDYDDFTSKFAFAELITSSSAGEEERGLDSDAYDGYGNRASYSIPDHQSDPRPSTPIVKAYMIGGRVSRTGKDYTEAGSNIQFYPFKGYIKPNDSNDYEVQVDIEIYDHDGTDYYSYGGCEISGNDSNIVTPGTSESERSVISNYTLKFSKSGDTYSIVINDGSTDTTLASGSDSSTLYLQYTAQGLSSDSTRSGKTLIHPTSVNVNSGNVFVMVRDD